MSFIKAADLAVHYDLSGPADAPVVMFANSLGTNFHVWDAQRDALAGQFRVLRYDMRGHGLTDCPTPTDAAAGYTIDQLAGDAVALLDALDLERVHFCGLSIGGMVAQRLGAMVPARLYSLVLCDTASRIGTAATWQDRVAAIRAGGMASIADAVMTRWFTPAFFEREPAALSGFRNMLARTPVDGYAGCCLAIRDADLRADCARITCPTQVVVGDQDASTPPALVRETAASIAGADLSIIEGAGHIPTAEQPEALNRILLRFLSAL
ncbi:MAG TPA: 3-oxoadipate enol-lactonase [Stellaceae bacterium]|nr:3-oxoadipate enol-lactonase [Stellaceae bacterium]